MRATRDDGVTVELNDDGTWTLVDAPSDVPPVSRPEAMSFAPPPPVGGGFAFEPAAASAPVGSPSTPSEVGSASDSGFRGSAWGSAPDAAAAREGRVADDAAGDIQVWGDVALAGLKWTAAYIYLDGRLARGKYILESSFHNEERYVAEFLRMRDLMAQKYGTPSDEQDIWSGDLYQDSPGEWGMAVASGELTRLVEWVAGDTRVSIILTGENFETTLELQYDNPPLSDEWDRRNESASLDDL